MDQYLTNGTARSIPIFIFIDEKGEEKAVWGPRAKEVQEIVVRVVVNFLIQKAQILKKNSCSFLRNWLLDINKMKKFGIQ